MTLASLSEDITRLLGLLLLVLVLVQGAVIVWLRRRPGRRSSRRVARAQRGEVEAESLLRQEGYRILESQPTTSWEVDCGEVTEAITLRADYLVARNRQRYVAEVKTGALAPRLRHGPTRRQLLEYLAAFSVEGALLVQPEAGRIDEVRFPNALQASCSVAWRWILAAAFATGLLIGLLVGRAFA